MKEQKRINGRKQQRNVWVVGMLATALTAGTLLTTGTGGLVSTVDAATTSTEAGTSASALTKFKDIKGHWAQATIAKAYDQKLISGYQDGTFRPNAKITRGEYATLLSRATRLEKVQSENPFADLKGHWSESAVTQLVGQGFINADDYPKGFNPNAELTRYEMMKWIANGLIKSGTSFQDAFNDTKDTLLPTPEVNRGTIRTDQIPYLALVRGTGIVGGFEDGSLKPADSTTRAEVSAILLRYMDVEGTDAGKYSDLNEMREVGTTGTNLTTISNYKYSSDSAKISDLSKGNITLSNKSGVMKIHRLIIVDATKSTPKGIYAPLLLEENYVPGSYKTFSDISFTSNLEKSNLLTFNQGLSDSLIQFNRLDLELAKENGVTTLPMNSSELIKKGVQKRFWITSTLRNKSWSYFLKSDTEGAFKIQR